MKRIRAGRSARAQLEMRLESTKLDRPSVMRREVLKALAEMILAAAEREMKIAEVEDETR